VTVPQLYGGTYTLFAHMFPALGIDVRFAADDSVAALEALIDENTKAVFMETIGNPAGNIVDIAAVLRWLIDTAYAPLPTTPWPRPRCLSLSSTVWTLSCTR